METVTRYADVMYRLGKHTLTDQIAYDVTFSRGVAIGNTMIDNVIWGSRLIKYAHPVAAFFRRRVVAYVTYSNGLFSTTETYYIRGLKNYVKT